MHNFLFPVRKSRSYSKQCPQIKHKSHNSEFKTHHRSPLISITSKRRPEVSSEIFQETIFINDPLPSRLPTNCAS